MKRFLNFVIVACLTVLIWVNLNTDAIALGGKKPPLNQPAPEFTLTY